MEREYWIPTDQVIYAVVYKQTHADIKSRLYCCLFLFGAFLSHSVQESIHAYLRDKNHCVAQPTFPQSIRTML